MPKLVYVGHDGTRRTIKAAAGTSVMKAAVDNNVPGIDGDCGGQCACATCHVYVDEDWAEKAGSPNDNEEGMLAIVVDRKANSRLSCQIEVSDALDGLLVSLPPSQH